VDRDREADEGQKDGRVDHVVRPAVADRQRRAHQQAHGLRTVSDARQGNAAEVLCRVAEDHEVHALVVGNKGMHRKFLGSVPNSVSHKAPCSVMIVKTG
jgi:nucleotide-binding universal stress UspA family protein